MKAWAWDGKIVLLLLRGAYLKPLKQGVSGLVLCEIRISLLNGPQMQSVS